MSERLYTGIDNLEVLADAVRYNRFLVDSLVRESTGSATAVDFGAGTGLLTAITRARGLDVVCVEQDPRLEHHLREQGFDVHRDMTQFGEQSCEYIYSLNVLEHIENDEETLAMLYSKLRPGGRLFLYVPALQMLFSSMDKKIGHYRRYHRRPLVRMMQNVGFSVERAEYADSLGVLATLLYKAFGSKEGHVSPATVKIYDRLFFPVSRALDRVGFSRLLGKNLLLVATRPIKGASSQ